MEKVSAENAQIFFAKATPAPGFLLKLTSEIAARIVRVSDESLDAEIIRSLRDILAPLGVDRGGLLEVRGASQVVNISHVWYAEGIEHVSGEINLTELFPWAARQLLVEEKIMVMDRLGDLPAEAAVDRQSHRGQESRSRYRERAGLPDW
jgi:hypothetical protein